MYIILPWDEIYFVFLEFLFFFLLLGTEHNKKWKRNSRSRDIQGTEQLHNSLKCIDNPLIGA